MAISILITSGEVFLAAQTANYQLQNLIPKIPADISQAATTKNYKSNFGSDLHIYLFVQVLLEQKLLTFGMKIK